MFEYNEHYEKNKEKYKVIRERILDENESSSLDGDDEGDEEKRETFRQTIYQIIQPCIHAHKFPYKLLQMKFSPQQEVCF